MNSKRKGCFPAFLAGLFRGRDALAVAPPFAKFYVKLGFPGEWVELPGVVTAHLYEGRDEGSGSIVLIFASDVAIPDEIPGRYFRYMLVKGGKRHTFIGVLRYHRVQAASSESRARSFVLIEIQGGIEVDAS